MRYVNAFNFSSPSPARRFQTRLMKHISPNQVEGQPVRAPTRRALAKQQTRVKVLAAARQLFSEQGYEGATIRDIAAAAGMSTGAVFANFTDKSDLFREIMVEDMTGLVDEMREATARATNVEEGLRQSRNGDVASHNEVKKLSSR